jgi:segregation and condensation protein B
MSNRKPRTAPKGKPAKTAPKAEHAEETFTPSAPEEMARPTLVPDGEEGGTADAEAELEHIVVERISVDMETTVNLTGPDLAKVMLRDDFASPAEAQPEEDAEEPPASGPSFEASFQTEQEAAEQAEEEAHDEESAGGDGAPATDLSRAHLKGMVEALVFAADKPLKPIEIARAGSAPVKVVRELLVELAAEYHPRGIRLEEVAGGWTFRTSPAFAPFVRDLTKQKPVRLTRAQVETVAIVAYRQPVTRPEIDDIRGVDSGPVLKMLLERDLVRILGKKDEPGRPLLYGTGAAFLELFGLKSLKDLPTLREFTELNEESRRTAEKELGEEMAARLDLEPEPAPAAPETDLHATTEMPSAFEDAEDDEGTPRTDDELAPEAAEEPPPVADLGDEGDAEPKAADDLEAEDEDEDEDDYDDDDFDEDDDDDDDDDDDEDDDDDDDEDDAE